MMRLYNTLTRREEEFAPRLDNTAPKTVTNCPVENVYEAAALLVFCRSLPQKAGCRDASRPVMINFVAARRMMVDAWVTRLHANPGSRPLSSRRGP